MPIVITAFAPRASIINDIITAIIIWKHKIIDDKANVNITENKYGS